MLAWFVRASVANHHTLKPNNWHCLEVALTAYIQSLICKQNAGLKTT